MQLQKELDYIELYHATTTGQWVINIGVTFVF